MSVMTNRIEQPGRVTRFEVIGDDGREYVREDIEVELHYQDDGRTLKVFIAHRGNTEASDQHRRELTSDLSKLRRSCASLTVLADQDKDEQ